jgi:hypothetical protein
MIWIAFTLAYLAIGVSFVVYQMASEIRRKLALINMHVVAIARQCSVTRVFVLTSMGIILFWPAMVVKWWRTFHMRGFIAS